MDFERNWFYWRKFTLFVGVSIGCSYYDVYGLSDRITCLISMKMS